MNRKLLSKTDLIVLACLLAAAALLAFTPRLFPHSGALRAVVTADGETVLDVALDSLTEPETHVFSDVEIEIAPTGARVVSSVCPDQICVRSGMLTKHGDAAACVPQKVVVKIVADRAPDGVDAVAY